MNKRQLLADILAGKAKPDSIPGSGVLTVSVAGNDLYNVNGVVVDLIELKRLQKRAEICMFWGGGFLPELTANAHKISFKQPKNNIA